MFSHLDLADENIYKIIDLLNIHIYWKDTQSKFLGCNTNVLKAFNLEKRQDFIGKNDYNFLEKSEADKIIAIDQSVLQGTPYHDEEVVILTNGEVRTYVTTKNPILDDNGKIIGILGTSVDITDIKNKMEKEKQEIIFNEEQKFRQIIDLVDASIYWKDREGRYLGCNKYVLKMAGIDSINEIIGKTDFDMLWKNEASKLREIDSLVITTNKRYEGEELISIANSNNSTPMVALTVKNPLLNKNGDIVGVVGTSLNITTKKEIEQLKLEAEKHKIYAEEQEKFRQIIDLVDASIYWKDREGRYLGCNKYVLRMAGITHLDEIIGKTDADMLWKNDTPKLKKIDELVMTTKKRYEGEEAFLVANNKGNPIVVLTVKNPLLDNQGNVIGIVGTSLDITAQKEAEQLKLEAEKHKIYVEEQEKFRQIIDLVDASIYWKDKEGCFLGCNKYVLKMAGITSPNEIIGKTDLDMIWKNDTPKLREVDELVMATKKRYEGEEAFLVANNNGNPIVVLTVKNPLLDNNGNVIGIVGTSINMTAKKEIEKLKLEAEKNKVYVEEQEKFRQIIDLVDASIYWKDKNGYYLGCNKYVLRMAGISSMDEIVGKSDADMLWKKDTPKLREVDELVMNKKKRYEGEEVFLVANNSGKPIVVLTVKNPLLDNQGNVIGIVGASLDITAQKEAEQLRIETEKHKIYAEEQEKFVKVVGQMAHDIRSPISTLKTIAQTSSELAEQKRITLRRATMNVEDITNHMLNLYKPQESALTENNQRQYVLVSVILMEIASERRYKYQNSPIQFDLVINAPQINNFVFIQIEPSNLRRMLSNLINNAVEALPKSGGKITVELNSNDEWVKIEVMDNGKGIPFETLYNLRQKIGVKTTKKTGFGIGLTQVFDVIESNYGRFEIDSGVGSGTTFAMRFPKAKAANWLASEINITPEDIIVIVDDDVSIHGAWDSRINYILEKFPTLQLKHFMEGNDALEFIHNLPAEKVKNNVYLLNDYELINEELNGLDIISKSGVKRAILVTSHYADTKVRKAASKMGTKILPKELAYCIPLKVQRPKYKPGELANVHMVFVDDDPEVVEQEIADHYSHLIIDVYHDPFEFLNDIDKYPKDTKIIMDNNYQSGGVLLPISGITLAETLHEKGYTKLYLYSWQQCDTPDYVVFILKTDREKMTQLYLL